MSISQDQAVWELYRQGLPLIAEEAAERWNQGQAFELDLDLRLPRSLKNLIRQCNWELRQRHKAG
jgi:Leu/Phe-tRNA-protein transferase